MYLLVVYEKMREIGLVEEGARLYHATSYHDEYMPENVIDRSGGKGN